MLSVTAQHALRALAVLAGAPEGAYLPGKELARQADIPPNYMSKILWLLGTAGFIDAARGNGGGYRLRRPAAQIHLSEIVDVLEGNRGASNRLTDDSLGQPASAQKQWRELDEALTRFLHATTVADIANNPGSR